MFVTSVMFVDVGENRAVLENLSLSFVSTYFTLACVCAWQSNAIMNFVEYNIHKAYMFLIVTVISVAISWQLITVFFHLANLPISITPFGVLL